jgi:hypothetical protein
MAFRTLQVGVATALLGAVLATGTTSPQSLKSDITIVVNNDLQGPSSPNAEFGFIYLSEKHAYSSAASACRALGESLWDPWAGTGKGLRFDDTLLKLLKAEVEESLGAWVAEKEGKPYRLLGSGALEVYKQSVELPVLCTQSAPFSNSSYQDKDVRWQVEVSANNENLVG